MNSNCKVLMFHAIQQHFFVIGIKYELEVCVTCLKRKSSIQPLDRSFIITFTHRTCASMIVMPNLYNSIELHPLRDFAKKGRKTSK
mmetsp:Transcript_30761/g.46541  ORF Transcript_30761/g.46541 Transcript_30761/m.46541 type:complete len:86 (-) Transcript_30761:2086-2343(-)